MQKNILVLCIIISMIFVGCATHVHNIGTGPVGTGSENGVKVTARQWYLFYGLVPLNSIDTNEMANSAENYEIQTQVGPIDLAIAVGIGIVTLGIGPAIIQSRTVTVTK